MSLSNDLDRSLSAARRDGRAALIPYLTAGFPDPAGYVDLALAVIEAGADVLEIGIPFSDPLLDGPSIQRSQHAALAGGVTLPDCLRFAAEIHQRRAGGALWASERGDNTQGVTQRAHRNGGTPLLFMGAYNPIFAYGPANFCGEAAASGISGLIVPDLPVEEQEELRAASATAGLHLIQLVAPTSDAERLRRVCDGASGFIYCVSVAGVTGARSNVAGSARVLVERVRRCTDLPVAVGFGIARPEVAREVAAFADGAIVGSALIDVIAAAASSSVARGYPLGTEPAYEIAAARFVSEMRRALVTETVA